MPIPADPDLRYELIRSRRRTLSLIVRDDGSLEIRCPITYPRWQIDRFIREKSAWINRKRLENRQIVNIGPLAANQRQAAADQLIDRFRRILANLPGLRPAKVTLRDQRSRWGSCSSRGNVAINMRCHRLPEILQDYVILHELCHLVHMNHSAEFWQLLDHYLPDSRRYRQDLRHYRLVQEE